MQETAPGLTEFVLVLASSRGLPVGMYVDALVCVPSQVNTCVRLCVLSVSKAVGQGLSPEHSLVYASAISGNSPGVLLSVKTPPQQVACVYVEKNRV